MRKADVVIAKNYMTERELGELNRLTVMFLDFAQDRAERRRPTLMADWVDQTDRFLVFNEREVLRAAGRVSAAEMTAVATERYVEFDERRRAEEAERAEAEELDDLRALIAIERRDEPQDGGPGA